MKNLSENDNRIKVLKRRMATIQFFIMLAVAFDVRITRVLIADDLIQIGEKYRIYEKLNPADLGDTG